MADTKISALAAKTAPGASDLVQLVDVSDTTMAGTGSNKKITAAQFHSPARFASYNNTSPTDGDLWYGSNQKTLAGQVDGLKTHFSGVIFSQTADASATNTTTETSIIGTGVGTVTLPANFLVAGKTLRLTARGYFATGSGGSSTLTLKLKAGSTVLVSSSAKFIASGTGNTGWKAVCDATCRTTGASGTVAAAGDFLWAATPEGDFTTSATTLDTTASQALNLTATWSVAQAASTAVCTTLTVEILN